MVGAVTKLSGDMGVHVGVPCCLAERQGMLSGKKFLEEMESEWKVHCNHMKNRELRPDGKQLGPACILKVAYHSWTEALRGRVVPRGRSLSAGQGLLLTGYRQRPIIDPVLSA